MRHMQVHLGFEKSRAFKRHSQPSVQCELKKNKSALIFQLLLLLLPLAAAVAPPPWPPLPSVDPAHCIHRHIDIYIDIYIYTLYKTEMYAHVDIYIYIYIDR
jgi:hypothetical protein